jgi:hypothetical protein
MAHTREWKEGDKTMVFIPFPRANSQEAINSTLGTTKSDEHGWNRFKVTDYGRSWFSKFTADDVFCADDKDRLEKLRQLKGAHDMLYLRGHCSAGQHQLTSPDRKLNILADQIVAYLSENEGLSTDFKGIIKVYSCRSGADYSIFWNAYVWESFAQRFADAMFDKGYRSCHFFGYTAKVSTWAEAKDLMGRYRKRAVDDNYNPIGSPTEFRKEFIPRKVNSGPVPKHTPALLGER